MAKAGVQPQHKKIFCKSTKWLFKSDDRDEPVRVHPRGPTDQSINLCGANCEQKFINIHCTLYDWGEAKEVADGLNHHHHHHGASISHVQTVISIKNFSETTPNYEAELGTQRNMKKKKYDLCKGNIYVTYISKYINKYTYI